jgi:hypothetical protein
MKRKLKVVSIILAVVAVVLIFIVVYYPEANRIEVRVELTPSFSGMWIRANLIEKPDWYVLKGDEETIKKAFNLVQSIRGEPPFKPASYWQV